MPFDGKNFDVEHDLTTPWGRCRYLADFMEGLPEERVIMSLYDEVRDCGTVHCIAGWAWALPELNGHFIYDDLTSCADKAVFFGVTPEEAYALTMPSGYSDLRKRPDGEPYKADVVQRLRETADLAEGRRLE